MGRVLRAQRKGTQGSIWKSRQHFRIGTPQYRNLDFSERHGYIRGVVRRVRHDPGRGAPINEVEFRNPNKFEHEKYLFIATEGTYSGQFIYAGSKAAIQTGNILPINQIPEGTVVCNIEEHPGDKGTISRCSGTSATIIGHSDDGLKSRIRLPSGQRKTISGLCRCTVGIVAGGGRTDKPVLKAGNLFHKFKRIRKRFPHVKGVSMNPVDHPHGGGNHKHIGFPSTVSRYAPPGQKVGLISARRTGLIRGGLTEKPEKN